MLPVASAQVKSCVLLAGLVTDATTVIEPIPSRDHTERLLLRAGASLTRDGDARHGYRTTVRDADELELDRVDVPGDMSSAAFLIAAGVLVPGSRLVLESVGVNWTRTGFLRILSGWERSCSGDLEPVGAFGEHEPVADLDVTGAPIEGTTVEAAEVPLTIDELPLVALLGCFAEGETVVKGSAELRIKESDRIAERGRGTARTRRRDRGGARWVRVHGTGALRGGRIDARGDHRLALLGAVAGTGLGRRASRSSGWRPPRSPTRASARTWRNWRPRDGRRDRRPGRRRQVERCPGRRVGARLHLPQLGGDVPLGRAGGDASARGAIGDRGRRATSRSGSACSSTGTT